MRSLLFLVAGLGSLAFASSALAATLFTATLEGEQEVPPVTTDASGSAELMLNDAQDRLEIGIQIDGLDLDGNQTPDDPSDDVVAAHIHSAPAGTNGGVVFGFISPNDDTNGDLAIDPAAGTIESAWDEDEGLGDELENLFDRGLYVNVHTTTEPGGEIRGQIVPEPGTAGLFAAGLIGLALRARRR